MDDQQQYLHVDEIARRTGIHPRTLDRRLAEGEITVLRDPADRRRRVIALDDLPLLTTPRPARDRMVVANRAA